MQSFEEAVIDAQLKNLSRDRHDVNLILNMTAPYNSDISGASIPFSKKTLARSMETAVDHLAMANSPTRVSSSTQVSDVATSSWEENIEAAYPNQYAGRTALAEESAATDSSADSDLTDEDSVEGLVNATVLLEEDSDDSSEDDSQYSAQYSEQEVPSSYRKSSSDDAVGAFFKEMARYPLLKPDEEIELARQVRIILELEERSEEMSERLNRRPQLAELAESFGCTEKQLKQRLQKARAAKRRMIRSNLRLVVSIAKRYLNRGVPFLDLIQEGALGLNRAAEKFDPDKGYKFSTYAYWWIRQGITRTIANDARTIRLPIHIVEKLNKLKKAHRELRKELQRTPTEAEVAESLDMTPDQLRALQQVQRKSLSLNHRVGKGEDTELMELLEDNHALSPESQISESMMRQEISDVLTEVLTEREKEIIALRYGLTTGETHTLEEVGRIFQLSRERVRQIQTKAMRKLRRPQVATRLKNWLK